jgi:hypothetical protein
MAVPSDRIDLLTMNTNNSIRLIFSRAIPRSFYTRRYSASSTPLCCRSRSSPGSASNTSRRSKIPLHRQSRFLQTASMSRRVPIESQAVDAPLTCAATFLVLSVRDSPEALKAVRGALASVSDLSKNVSIRRHWKQSLGPGHQSAAAVRTSSFRGDKGRKAHGCLDAWRPSFPYSVGTTRPELRI